MTIIREQSFAHVAHPEWIDGRRIWRDGGVEDIVRRIQQGDPTKGWEGDPRLEVYFEPALNRWELWRLESDGQYRLTMASKPGVPLDIDVIDYLVAHDRNRGFDIHRVIHVVNDGIRRRRCVDFLDWIREEIGPRIAHAASKGRIHSS